jgi:hypothetical protein
MVYKLFPQHLNVLHSLQSGQELIGHPITVGAKSATVKIIANWKTHSDNGNISIDLDDGHGRRKAFIFFAQEIESIEALKERGKQEETLHHPPDITHGCITVSKISQDVVAVLATVHNGCDSAKTVTLTYGEFLKNNTQSQSREEVMTVAPGAQASMGYIVPTESFNPYSVAWKLIDVSVK